MAFIGKLLILALDVYSWIIIASVVISWLVAFEVVNVRNDQAANLIRLLDRATEKPYAFLRRYIPAIGGIDLSPIILLLGIYIAKEAVYSLFF